MAMKSEANETNKAEQIRSAVQAVPLEDTAEGKRTATAVCAVTGDTTMVLRGISLVFEGMQMMMDGLVEQTELAVKAAANATVEVPVTAAIGVTTATKETATTAATEASTGPTGASTGSKPEKATRYKAKKTAAGKPPVRAEKPVAAGSADSDENTRSKAAVPAPIPDSEEDDELPFEEAPTQADGTTQADGMTQADGPAQDALTLDSITKVVVSKIRQKRSNTERINKLVNAYGVSQLSSLPTDKYEAFLNDLSDL